MKFIFVIFLFAAIHSFGQQKEFGWLVGTWQEEGKNSYEVWKENSGFLEAESYNKKDGNKIVTEEIKLIKKGNDFYYVPDVAGTQGSIKFKITSFGKSNFTAENPAHDFPNKIVYEKIDDAHLKATISDANKSISHSFIKIK
jgi:hypothetical protein